MKKYKLETLRDMYRVVKKYWKTRDTDYIEVSLSKGQQIDDRFWSEIHALVTFAVRAHKKVDTVVRALELFGYEVEEEKREAEE